MQNFEFFSESERETANLAEKIANIAKTGDIFALYGTLGVGKSVFARAFIQYLSGAKEVPSPTFTLLQIYEARDFDIYHYDMYRIKSPEEVFELGIEDAFYTGVSIIEWPEKMEKYLPQNTIKIHIKQLEDKKRQIIVNCENSNQLLRLRNLR